MKRSLVAAGLLAAWLPAANAQDAYLIGLSGALTGPNAGVYAPVVEEIGRASCRERVCVPV